MVDEEILKEINRQKYRDELDKHRNDFEERLLLFLNSVNPNESFLTPECINKFKDLIGIHDVTKYGEDEFEYYRIDHYPVNEKEKKDNEDELKVAKKHHYKHNPHHWQHWLDDNGEPTPIPIIYCVEMVVDWDLEEPGKSAYQYYQENKDEMKIHPRSREYIERLLEYTRRDYE